MTTIQLLKRHNKLLEDLCHHLRWCMQCHDNGDGYGLDCPYRTRLWREAGLGDSPYPVLQDPLVEHVVH